MSKNKNRTMQKVVRYLEKALEEDIKDPHALPGTVVKKLKEAKKALLRDIRKRRESREREKRKI